MSDFTPTMDKALLDVIHLWATTPPYSDYPCETIANRLIPAVRLARTRYFYDQNRVLRAFATYGFMTNDEFDTRNYWGWEVFSRNGGEKLVIVDMIAPGGKNDVLFVSRDLRKFFKSAFPDVKKVYAHRGRKNGVFPNKGG